MANTLVSPEDLAGFPGFPFAEESVDVAAAQVRAEAGWHIAPVVTETLLVDSYGGYLLSLPTRRVAAITAVRGVTGELGTWTHLGSGLYRRSGWPVGVLEVDLTHGYAEIPSDLLPVVAARASGVTNPRDPALVQRSVGQVQESYRQDGGAHLSDPAVARYAVPAGVA
jgi:hypothetical protein